MNAHPPKRRKATSVPLDERLVAEAGELGVDLSEACEAGLAAEVREARGRQWVAENHESIQGWNDWVQRNGLPLAKYRQF